MHDTTEQSSRGAARPQEATEGLFLVFDLMQQVDQLVHENYWQGGHNSKTIVKFPDFRMVLTAIKAGTRIQEHQSAGRMSIQTLLGHIRMHGGEQEFDLPRNQLLVLDRNVTYDVEALESSAYLLTIAWPEGEE